MNFYRSFRGKINFLINTEPMNMVSFPFIWAIFNFSQLRFRVDVLHTFC